MESKMGLNIGKISMYNGNRYQLANACIKYSEIVAVVNEEAYKANNGKVVMPAINDVLAKNINFTTEPLKDLEVN